MKKIGLIFGVLVPIFVSIFALYSLWQLKNQKTTVARIEFSEAILQVSKYMAQERGFTYVFAHENNGSDHVASEIVKARRELNRYFEKAIALAGNLDIVEVEAVTLIRDKFEKLRQIKEFSGENAQVTMDSDVSLAAADWFENASALISSLGEMYGASVEQSGQDMERLETSASLISPQARFAIWQMSEYAGQERALIGAAVAHKSPLPREKITANWLMINEAWVIARESLFGRLGSLQLTSSFNSVENIYFGSYVDLRSAFLEVTVPEEEYPLDLRRWLEKSTRAIDSIITLSESLSRNTVLTISNLKYEAKEKRRNLFIFGMSIITVIIGLLFLYLITLYIDLGRARRVRNLYSISNKLLRVASALALERGISRAAIASRIAVGSELMKLVSEQRETTKKKLLPAIEEFQSIRLDKHNHLVMGVRAANIKVQQMHEKADRYFTSGELSPDPELAAQLFEAFTQLIVSTEELQLAASHSFALEGRRVRFWNSNINWYENLVGTAALRHFIWLMSEYAGRQRALVGTAISSGECIPEKDHAELTNKIRSSWEIVKLEVIKNWHEPEVREGLEMVKANFFDGLYPSTMKKVAVCSSATTKSPCYEIEPVKWFEISTAAIDEVLNLSKIIGKSSEDRLFTMIHQETWQSVVRIFLCFAAIALMLMAINT